MAATITRPVLGTAASEQAPRRNPVATLAEAYTALMAGDVPAYERVTGRTLTLPAPPTPPLPDSDVDWPQPWEEDSL